MHAELSTSSDLVSVIIPVYNNAQELRVCLETVLRSEYAHFEVLVVDDGSTDASEAVAQSFSGVRVLRQKNQGSGAARNFGAAEAKGKWLLFLDSDVRIRPDLISGLVQTATEYDVDLVHFRYSTDPLNDTLCAHYKALVDSVLYIPTDKMGQVIVNGQMNGGGEMFSAASFQALGGFKKCFAGASVEREEMWIRFYEAGYSSAGNTTLVTRHMFPDFLTLLKNYVSRIYLTVAITEGKKPPFTYISIEKSVLGPIFACLTTLSVLASLCGMVPWLWTLAFFLVWLTLNRHFIRMGIKHKGVLMTMKMIPLHFFFATVICIAGSIAKCLVKLFKPTLAGDSKTPKRKSTSFWRLYNR